MPSFLKRNRLASLRRYFHKDIYTEQQCNQRVQNFVQIMASCLSVIIVVNVAFLFTLIIGDNQLWVTLIETDILLGLMLTYIIRKMSQWTLIPQTGMDTLCEFAQPYNDIVYYLQKITDVRATLTDREFHIVAKALEQCMRNRYSHDDMCDLDHSVDMLA